MPFARVPREPAAVIPAVFVPAFFYSVNLGALEKLAGTALDYKAFLLPMAIAFARERDVACPWTPASDIQGGVLQPAVHDPDQEVRPPARADGGRCGRDRRPVPACPGHRRHRRGALCHRLARSPGVRRLLRGVGPGLQGRFLMPLR